MNKIKHLFTLLVLLANIIPAFAQINCDHPDYAPLAALYEATDGDNWINSWDLSNCDICSYFGIMCNEEGRITRVKLDDNNLTGFIPSEIGELKYLESLSLSENNLSSSIPTNIGELTALSGLQLNTNQLSGNIPPEIGNLSGLTNLKLDFNQLSGTIPSEIGNLTNILNLDLRENNLSGNIPPSLGNLSLGIFLILDNNNLSGNLPKELGSFGNQREINPNILGGINVANNNLSGCYPIEFKAFCRTDFRLIVDGNENLSDFSDFCFFEDGVCDTTMLSCDKLQFISDSSKIVVTGLSTTSKVEIIGENTDYQPLIICDSDCQESQEINDLENGDYTVKVLLFDGENYCYREEVITISKEDANENIDSCILEIINITYPDTVVPGDIITITATIKNNGNSPSKSTPLFLAQQTTFSDILPSFDNIESVDIPIIPAGGEKNVSITYETSPALAKNIFYPMFSFGRGEFFLKFSSELEKCQQPIISSITILNFFIKYPKVDLALSLDTENLCVDSDGILQTNLKVTNLSSTSTINPIFINFTDCGFVNLLSDDVECRFSISFAYAIINPLSPGQSAIIAQPFKQRSIDSFVIIRASVMSEISLIDNINSQPFEESGVFNNPIICQEISSSANCTKLAFSDSNGQIKVDGLTANYNKVEIIGRNTDWQIISICDGDCPPTLSIPDLESGEYAVKVNQSGNDGSYCYREEKVIIGNNSNDTADCGKLNFIAGNGAITIEGLTANYDKVEIIGRNTDWQVVSICDGDCSDTQIISDLAAGEYAVKVNQGGSDGSFCYREEAVLLENGSSSRNGGLDFEDNLVLYPNPARERINIQLPNLTKQRGTVHIYNVFGQLISTTLINELNQDVLTFDLSSFENGIYLMSIQIDGLSTINRRLVVEHLK